MTQSALVVGATGIAGGAITRLLLDRGWDVAGLSRSSVTQEGMQSISADLLDPSGLAKALRDTAPSHLFITT